MGELFNPPPPTSGAFVVLQDTPALTADAFGVYALNFILPANSIRAGNGLLLCQSNAQYSFTASAANPNFGLVLYNAGDSFGNGNAPGLIGPNAIFNAHTYCSAAVYDDTVNGVTFLESVSQFNSATTPNQAGGAGSGGNQITMPNVSGLLNFALPITCQLVFFNNGPNPPTRVPTYLSGYSRLILVN